jgi:hypothetical protein
MLSNFVVLYVIVTEGIMPQPFSCQAENADHAEEQCLDAYPTADVVWVEPGDNVGEAFVSYWEELDGGPVAAW